MAKKCNLSRRNFIGIGFAGGLSWLNRPKALQAFEGQHRDGTGHAKNVLVILEQGGKPHTDTWDPKPDTL